MVASSDQKDATEGKENGPATDKHDEKPSKPQKPSKLRTDEDGKPSMTDGNASFLRAARAGNLDKVLEYLKGSTDINTSNANGLNALHLSSKEGHLNIVTELLKRGANVNAATKKGNTALHIGALAGQEEIVKVLIEHGADVNVQSQNGFTPLYMAAQENHTGVVKFLLSNKADQNLATEDGFTPLAVALQQGHDKVVAVLLENDRAGKTRLPALHIAARKDDTKAASLLLQSGHNPDVTSKSGFTPLHIAAHYGHVNVATLLLQKGATVDYSARNHITPLHVAAKWGKVNMVNTLLDRGAKIDAKTRDGLTPLHCSARSGHDHCVDQLLERGAPISNKSKSGLAPLHMAAQGDHVDSARLLLFHKAPVDDVTADYLTPLHVAAHCGHHRVAKLLLDRKATADARALNGFTPLHIACKKNRIKVIELLLKYGANIHATTESGLTPLHAAAFMGNVQIVPYLIKNGAKVNETNVRGETPLHLAARSNQIDVMKILIDNGATVDARAHENQTPLHIAARLGNAEIVTLLLEKGANADAQTRDQYTALHIAAREGKEDVAAVLLDSGATLSMKTKKEFTPLHVAAKYGRLEVASLLLRNYAAPDAKAQNGLTPLHIAAHYDNVDVAMLLLDHGASPHTAAKNGFTPLHIAAKKNQMDVATTLLEYGADPNATTKHGISPVHLAALEGHSDMLSLLLERGAKPDIVSKNGLTPLHLAAQEDQLNCAVILVNSNAEVDPKTKAGYTPLHVASHYGNIKTATYLLEHNASVEEKTKHGLTPLHQGAQQGHVGIVNVLLTHKADPNEKANNGYTPLAIAKRLGYISVVNTLTIVTEETTIVTSPNDEKLKVQVPETMVVNFMSDSDDEDEEPGDDVSMTGDQLVLSPQEIRTMGDDSVTTRKSWQDDWMNEPNMNYFSGVGSLSGHYSGGSPSGHLSVTSPSGYSTLDSRYGDRSVNGDSTLVDGEGPIVASSELIVESAAPMLHSTPTRLSSRDSDNEGPRSIPSFHGFLISFIVDARGGTMRSKRLPGLRLVVPPKRASGPTRVTCRLIKRTKLQTPPPLVENEALSTRVIEVGPSNTQFLGPVLLEVPHFASLRGKEREIVVLRSDNGESWKEHSLGATDEEVKKAMDGFEVEDNNVPSNEKLCRIITKDFPQYFAIISRVRQETNIIGPQGGMLSSSVVPQVQAVFPEGTLTKKIKVGLQAQPVSNDAVKKVLGNRVMVSPIVTIEPRRRKFHKPITVTIPVPTAYNQGVNNYGGDTPTLRLLCSISGGTAPAQWEDITGTTPLTFVNDCVNFTTTVSARFWLMDCKEIDQASNFARELYQELKAVPFMSKFVVFAKTHDPGEARVRVFCVTDDKIDKPLEQKEEFKEVARSKDVEVMDGRPVYIEMAGNLVPVQKSGEQLHLNFHAFHENRLPFFVRMRDQMQDPCGRLSFMREPRVQRGLPQQVPVCNLNVTMPPYVKVKKATDSESESESESEDEDILLSNLNFDYIKDKKQYTFPEESSRGPETDNRPEIILWDVANKLGSDWPALGRQLGSNDREIKLIENENDDLPEQAFVVLHLWAERQHPPASTSQLADALQAIGRGDIVDQCLPEDKPLDVTVTTSKGYSPLRGDMDSPRDRHTDITIDITGPPVDESFDAPSRKGPEETSHERMNPVQVQQLADLLNEVDEEEASPDDRPEDLDNGPHVEEQDYNPSEHTPVQSESPKMQLSPEDEKELQDFWDMDWPEPGEKPLSANLAEKVESAPPSQLEESAPPAPRQESDSPGGMAVYLESGPRSQESQQGAPSDGGKLVINFDPNAGIPTGFDLNEERQKELEDLWQAETGPQDQSMPQDQEEDDGPTVQENMAPGKLPPASAQRKVQLTDDDEKELQDFWDNPPAEPREPESLSIEESAPPPDRNEPIESAPLPQESEETESAPSEDSKGGTLVVHFDPKAGIPTGFDLNPEREKELQELWEAEPGPEDQTGAPEEDEDDGPMVQENMAPGRLPPASARRRFKLTDDDERELQDFFQNPPAAPVAPQYSSPAQGEESAPAPHIMPSEESAPLEEGTDTVGSFPPIQATEPNESVPEPQEYDPTESAPPPESTDPTESTPPSDEGYLVINFDPKAGVPTGYEFTPDREKEVQELWEGEIGPEVQAVAPDDREDNGPEIKEDAGPEQQPTTTDHKLELTEDDEKELQDFWEKPPPVPVEPQDVPQTTNGLVSSPMELPAGAHPGDDDVKEEVEVEEFEEELPDGTIRKVIRKRIKRSTIQMVPIEVDPSDLPPGATHNIVVHKKVTKNTVVRDGEEVETTENVDTEIEQDGIVTDAAELRDDLQQLVDQFLADGTVEGAQVISDEQQVIDESDI